MKNPAVSSTVWWESEIERQVFEKVNYFSNAKYICMKVSQYGILRRHIYGSMDIHQGRTPKKNDVQTIEQNGCKQKRHKDRSKVCDSTFTRQKETNKQRNKERKKENVSVRTNKRKKESV